MYKLAVLFLFTQHLIAVQAQDITKAYVKNNTHKVISIEPAETDFSDLQSIGNAIGGASIVMLGEQNHGDAAAFSAKSRLVKYLHEKKGFNVLAFESDFFCLNKGWDQLDKTSKTAIDSFVYNNVYPVWTLCYTCNDLFYSYISGTFKTNTPLHISGIDCQMYGNYSTQNFTKQFAAFIVNYPQLAADAAVIMPLLDSVIVPNFIKTGETAEKLALHLGNIRRYIATQTNVDVFWKQLINSLLAEVTDIQMWQQKDTANYFYRDMQMADNLDWLCRYKYPGQKIIVWAHSAHISKNSGSTFDAATAKNLMMGSFVDSNPFLRDKVYRIGFTSCRGYASWANKTLQLSLQKPHRQGFENWVDKRLDYAFTDFTQFRRQYPDVKEPFYMKGGVFGGHFNEYRAWTDIFEGVFFIRNMYGCKPRK